MSRRAACCPRTAKRLPVERGVGGAGALIDLDARRANASRECDHVILAGWGAVHHALGRRLYEQLDTATMSGRRAGR